MSEQMFMNPVSNQNPGKKSSENPGTRMLPDAYWHSVASRISERGGEAPTPLGLRAHAIIRALGLPSGQFSSLEFRPDGTRDAVAERIYSERVVTPAGVETEKSGIPTSGTDVLSLAADEELLGIMSEDSAAIIRADQKQRDAASSEYSPMLYFRLPAGVDLFVKGVTHDPSERLDTFIGGIMEHAGVVALEGRTELPYGASIRKIANQEIGQDDRFGGYEQYVVDALDKGQEILFAEVDPRDESKVTFDSAAAFDTLPDGFFDAYYGYLSAQDPGLADRIGGIAEFKKLLRGQTGSNLEGIRETVDGRKYYAHAFVDRGKHGDKSTVPTGYELGQLIFSDAVSAIRLHLIAKLMSDGKIRKGPIVDFQGSDHLSGKQFFLRYPEYAMEVALRSLPEILASDATGFFRKGKINSVSEALADPDWESIAGKIGTVAFLRTKKWSSPKAELVNVFEENGIDIGNLMPSDAEIADVIKRSAAARTSGTESDGLRIAA
ncbi:MAG TPA: hypothetical protein VN420_05715 [Candidatus Fimivivens sp.]|nr:hypothetical protein [Candidatus Fimivivens sp.]